MLLIACEISCFGHSILFIIDPLVSRTKMMGRSNALGVAAWVVAGPVVALFWANFSIASLIFSCETLVVGASVAEAPYATSANNESARTDQSEVVLFVPIVIQILTPAFVPAKGLPRVGFSCGMRGVVAPQPLGLREYIADLLGADKSR